MADGIDHIVGEHLGADIENAQIRIDLDRLVTNGMQQVGFAESYAAMYEERVVLRAWSLGDCAGCSMRHAITATHHVSIKSEIRQQISDAR